MTTTDGKLIPKTLGKAWLLVIAAPKEATAVVRGLGGGADPTTDLTNDWSAQRIAPGFDAVLSGVGKANAAGATARALDLDRHQGVISLGIGGCLPGPDGSFALDLGACVLGAVSVYADEGVQLEDGWASMAQRGFGPSAGTDILTTHDGMGIAGDPDLAGRCRGIVDDATVIATVSACSGSDASARAVAARTGAAVEAMEGAAVGFTVTRITGGSMPFIELRVVSNTTGGDQRWDLAGSLEKLTGLSERLAGVLTG